MRHEGARIQQMEVLPVKSTVHHGSYPDALDRQRSVAKLRGQQAALGGPASQQAATRVNPEQASKVKSWTPTRLNDGEGRGALGKQPSGAPDAVHRGSGSGMWTRMCAQRGRSDRVRGRSPQRLARGRRDRKSEGLVVPLRPGNAGGGKEPCFWDAFDRVEDRGLA
ncbi:MAG: hypothetical protein DRI30_07470 [Chloroflexi bacterium]|nr:MAG: hypothetical protein DRI30_07470 [Chloroflexota bacterium]